MTRPNRFMVVVLALAALAFPALSAAKGGNSGSNRGSSHGHGEKSVSWNVKGTVSAVGEDTVTVLVARSNHHGRGLRDREVTFDVSAARIVTADRNGDGERNLADVSEGDDAKVQSRRPRNRALAEGEALPAKKAIFKAPEPDEDEDEADEAESES